MDVPDPIPALTVLRSRDFVDEHARVDHNLTLQPMSAEKIKRIEELRRHAKAFGHRIVDLAPPSRERSLALTELEDSLQHAVASIARAVEVPV